MPRCFLFPDEIVSPPPSLLDENDIWVPLLIEGVAALHKSPQYRALGDIVSPARLCLAAGQANTWLREFARAAGGGRQLDGVDWFACCAQDVEWYYLRNVALGLALAEGLDEKEVREVIWYGRSSYDPWEVADGLIATLRSRLGNRFRVVTNAGSNAPVKTPLWKRVGARVKRIRTRWSSKEAVPSPARVVAVFALREGDRFTEPLRELADVYGEGMQIWHLGKMANRLEEWAAAQGIEVWQVPMSSDPDADIRAWFQTCWQEWLVRRHDFAQTFDAPIFSTDALLPHWDKLFNLTLPLTAQWGRTLRRRLEQVRPEWLVGSAATTATTIMPYLVARALGVRSLALSHTFFPGDYAPIQSDLLACRNRYERENYQSALPQDERVVYCRDAVNRLTYAPHTAAPFAPGAKMRVALLAGGVTAPGVWLPWVDPQRGYEMLEQVMNPPETLDDMFFWFKGHPRVDLSHLGAGMEMKSNVQFYGAKQSLSDLLEQVEVIVLCDALGSINADAIATGKPILFLRTAPVYIADYHPTHYQAGEIVSDVPSLWSCLNRLRAEPEYYQALQARCKRFCAEALAPAALTVAAQLERLSVPLRGA